MIRLSCRIIESWNAVIRAMLNVMNSLSTWHKHSFFIVLPMNDGFISIIIFWGQGFMVKHWRTPFLWDFIHALSIAQLTDGVQYSLIRLKRWRIAPCLLIWGITQKSPVLYSLTQDFEFRDQQNPFVFFANWLALPSINHRNHAVLIWTGEASIASPDSTHRFLPDPFLDKVIGSMYSRASSASQS